jgi:hypothetical protein
MCTPCSGGVQGTKRGARREGLEGKALMVPIDPGRHRVQGAPESPPRYRPRLRCRLRTPSTPGTTTRHIHAVPVQQAYLFKATVQSIKDYDEDWRGQRVALADAREHIKGLRGFIPCLAPALAALVYPQ